MSDQRTQRPAIDRTQLARGDVQQWRQLLEDHLESMQRAAHGVSGSDQDANDAVQSVLLNLWKSRANLPNIRHLPSYLTVAARNRALTAGREVRKKEGGLRDSIDPGRGPVAAMEQADRVRVLAGFEHRLTVRQRVVWDQLKDEPDLSGRQIARRLGCSHKNIQAIIHRIRRALQVELSAAGGEPPPSF